MTDEALKVDPHETLYVTDAEMIRRLGVPEKIARAAIRDMDKMEGRASGFPQKQPLWGNRRYWPAVKAFFDRHGGMNISGTSPKEGRRRYG